MRQPLLMPKLGLTMTEGVLADWLVSPGQRFKAGDVIYIVETEKVSNEIPADREGVFVEARVPVGESVPCGQVLGYWDDEVAPAEAGESAGGKAGSEEDVEEHPEELIVSIPGRPGAASGAPSVSGAVNRQGNAMRVIATPLARRLAGQQGVDLGRLRGTGPKGRIVARDVQTAVGASEGKPPLEASTTVSQQRPATAATTMPARSSRLIKPTTVQVTAARRLTAGKQQTPHFYLALEAQVGRLTSLRAELKEAGGGQRLTVNHFILAAVGRALREMPQANRVWTDAGIVEFAAADIGVAVNTPRGLVAPLLRDVAGLRITELARRSDALIESARAGGLLGEDFEGGSITVSNAGMHNVTYMTSIINPGQSMILGVGSIRDVFRPDEAGQPKALRELGLVLSVDHRVTDGVGALRFLNLVVDLLQRPACLLLD